MRKLIALLAVAGLTLGLAACGSDDDDPEAGESTTTTAASNTTQTTVVKELAKVDCNGTSAYNEEIGDPSSFTPVEEDTLTVVTSLPGPGFWEGSESDPAAVTSGLEYDMAKAIQEELGLANLEVRNESFDAIVAGTVTDYDLALSQVTITCERAQVVDFSIPYFASNQGVLVKSDFDKPLDTLEDAKALRWGVQTGTTAVDLLDEIQPNEQPSQYQSLADAYTALDAGQIDAVIIDTAINLAQAAASNGTQKVIAQFEIADGPDNYGAIFPEGSTNAPAINGILKQMIDSGDLSQLTVKNLTADPGNIPTIQVP